LDGLENLVLLDAHEIIGGGELYLSETPSIGWEAKTLGAKRRISSAQGYNVPSPKLVLLGDFRMIR
jgi:hypothetical protein